MTITIITLPLGAQFANRSSNYCISIYFAARVWGDLLCVAGTLLRKSSEAVPRTLKPRLAWSYTKKMSSRLCIGCTLCLERLRNFGTLGSPWGKSTCSRTWKLRSRSIPAPLMQKKHRGIFRNCKKTPDLSQKQHVKYKRTCFIICYIMKHIITCICIYIHIYKQINMRAMFIHRYKVYRTECSNHKPYGPSMAIF